MQNSKALDIGTGKLWPEIVTVQPRTLHLLQSPYDKADAMGIRLFANGKLPMSRIPLQ